MRADLWLNNPNLKRSAARISVQAPQASCVAAGAFTTRFACHKSSASRRCGVCSPLRGHAACPLDKIEFSFLNDNLIVRGARPSMLSAMLVRANNVSSSISGDDNLYDTVPSPPGALYQNIGIAKTAV
jgi:hypothetical protein